MTITALPTEAYDIIELLSVRDLMTQSEIQEALGLDRKTVKYAIRRLQENEIVQQVPHLLDMRSVNYRLPEPEEMRQVVENVSQEVYNRIQSSINSPLPTASQKV